MKLLRVPVLLYSVYVLLYVDRMVAGCLLQSMHRLWHELNEAFSIDAFEVHYRMIWQFGKFPNKPSPRNILVDAIALNQMIYKIDYQTIFAKDECYLIVSQGSGTHQFEEKWEIFYYVGDETPLHRRQAAAEFGMKMYSILTQYRQIDVHFYRELIGYETPVLQEVFNLYHIFELPPTTNLYLVKGNETEAVIEKIPLSPGWLNDDNNYCLVLEIHRFLLRKPPHVYCPCNTTELERKTAKKLAIEIHSLSPYYGTSQVIYFEKENITSWPTFKKELDKWASHMKRHEEDDIRQRALAIDHTYVEKHNEAVTLYKITDGVLEKVQTGPLTFNLLKHDACYVVDSSGFGGLYVVVGNRVDTISKIKAIRSIEEMFGVKYDSRTPVTIMELGRDVLDLKINFVGWSHNPNVKLDPVTQEYPSNAFECQ